MISLCHRFASLERADRRLVLEAALLMALVWAGLRVLRFATLRRVLDRYVDRRPTREETCSRPASITRVGWVVNRVGGRFPSSSCLVQALAGDAMLRRRGLPAEVHIGVRASGRGAAPVEAHAWVNCDGLVAIGAIEDLSDFSELTASRRV